MSQASDILNHIDMFGSITDNEARDYYGCNRCSARIYDLRKRGESIKTEMISGKNRFGIPFHCARYSRG